MSAITIEDELVHYEVLGRGKPIILIHSWLGSWRYWVPTMQQLAMKYRCYALDLWGFGDSGKDPTRYALDKQVELLEKFMDRMGIPKVVLVGHGLGASIAAQFAIKPTTAAKVHRMMLIAPPLVDAAPTLTKMALTTNTGTPAITAVMTTPEPPVRLTDSQAKMPPVTVTTLPETVSAKVEEKTASTVTAPPAAEKPQVALQPANAIKHIFEEHPLEELLSRATDPATADYEKLKAETAKTDKQAVHTSAEAFSRISTFRDILTATAPLCAVLGENDSLLPKPEETLLQQLDERPSLKLVVMGNTQHFPMLEDKAQFVRLLKDFLEAPDISTLEMKEEWRRRKR